MRALWISALIGAATLLPLNAQPAGGGCCCMGRGMQSGGAAPIASNPVVEIQGVIKQVHTSRGQGMPYLDVEQRGATTKVYLGSMRYLVAENFNPKAGQEVMVKGYKTSDSVIAIQVTLTAEKRTLKLRDEKGWPLWRGGPMRFGRMGPG